jgi:hypothetical protein
MGRARVPARRESVPEANGVFSSLIREGYGLRERGSRGRDPSQRWVRQPPNRYRETQTPGSAVLTERFRVLPIVVVKSSPFL